MATAYLGEIRMGGWSFAPAGWAFCDGSLLSIADFSALFNLIGTTYGGDGQNTFALPDFRGRIPIHQGGNFSIGQRSGSESVTLTTNQMPSHSHALVGTTSPATAASPAGNVLAQTAATPVYNTAGNPRPMANAVGQTGGNQSHDNLHPFQCVTFIIALEGVYPSQN